MPVYEYQCIRCGEKFELLRRMCDRYEETACPKCGEASAGTCVVYVCYRICKSSGSNCAPSASNGSL